MTARIKKSFSFQAGVYFNEHFYLNYYTVSIYFNIETESIVEQGVAMERISYFINNNLESSVFINQTNPSQIEKYIDASIKVCTLPVDPFDQIIAIMLVKKLNAIMEGRMIITDVSVTSLSSDDIHCLHSIEENHGPFNELGWWDESSPKYNSLKSIKSAKSKKLVKLVRPINNWEDLNLSFTSKPEIDLQERSEVVFLNFDKKTDR
jgi:hypothetical protein